MTSKKTLLFGLTYTDNVDEAEDYATQLGETMTESHRCGSFSPEWVLKHVKDSPDVGCFVIDHCDDEDTLDIIARRENRQAVLRTLARNVSLRDLRVIAGR